MTAHMMQATAHRAMAGPLAFLAEGINTGNNDHEGWGGLVGIAVVVAAVTLTILIVRSLGRGSGRVEEESTMSGELEDESPSEENEHAVAGRRP